MNNEIQTGEQGLDIRTRFKAAYKGRTIGWYDTWEEAEEALEIAQSEDSDGAVL